MVYFGQAWLFLNNHIHKFYKYSPKKLDRIQDYEDSEMAMQGLWG